MLSSETPRAVPRRESVQLGKQNIGGNFGSKLTFTVGTAYLGFGALGLLMGALSIKKPKFTLPSTRLLVSYYLKNMGQTSIQYANNAGGAAMLYILSSMGFRMFEENLANVPNFTKNAMIGFTAGTLYKLPRGWRAGLIGGFVGMGITMALNATTDFLRERDYIKFEMRFDG